MKKPTQGTFAASVRNFSEKALRNADLVVKQSTQDVAKEMTQPKDGLVRGASFEKGIVPVDEGELINSVVVQIDGAVTAEGGNEQPPDYGAALMGMNANSETIIGFSAVHARPIEYGTGNVPGRFMVKLASQKWNKFVAANAARLI